jgi:hypothetical protein
MIKYCDDKGIDGSTLHNCLVEWNDIDKKQSWINFFALSLSNPTPIISYARSNNLLQGIPFCHIIQYCKSRSEVEIERINKTSTSSTSTRYIFGVQVPKGIKSAIDLDKKNGNSL